MTTFCICEKVSVEVVDNTFHISVNGEYFQSTLNPIEYINQWNLLVSHVMGDFIILATKAWNCNWDISADDLLAEFERAERFLCNHKNRIR